ncbi:hypothetical protein ACJX0J_007996, partial [Zea mays]
SQVLHATPPFFVNLLVAIYLLASVTFFAPMPLLRLRLASPRPLLLLKPALPPTLEFFDIYGGVFGSASPMSAPPSPRLHLRTAWRNMVDRMASTTKNMRRKAQSLYQTCSNRKHTQSLEFIIEVILMYKS